MNIHCKMERIANISSLYRGQRPHKFEEKMLTFQALAWDNEDQNINGDDDEDSDEDYEYNGSDNENNTVNHVKKKYKDKRLTIRTYGLTQNGISVCLEILGFEPYFLLKLPPLWDKSKIKILENRILGLVTYQKKNLSFQVVKMKKLYFFDNNKDHTFLKISFKTDSARWDTIKALIPPEKENISPAVIKIQKTIQINIEGGRYNLDVYESTMDTIIRFIHLSGVKPSGIIGVDSSKLQETKTCSTCQIVKSVNWKDVQPINEDWVAPFRISSFDIECTSGDGKFPQADRIEDKIIQIGTTTRIFGEKYCRVRHIVTLKKSNDISDIKHKKEPNELVIIESVDTEKELLILWAKYICSIDPDIMIGYNIFTFDWKYIYDRANLLKCVPKLSILGRISKKECKIKSKNLSSSAMGFNSLNYPLIDGRIQIDLLPVIRSSHSLSSYKLDNVAKNLLGTRKNDLPPDQIFAKFNTGSPEDIKIIAEYCIQDCILVNDLLDKLDILINSIGMSNVCLVPINLLFTRGQGIKVYSKITQKCLERNTAFPTLVKLEHKKNGKDIGYEGAIVLDPIPGFYDKPIVVLDYGSLYPSSMIEYDISYETYNQPNDNEDKSQEDLKGEGELPGYRNNSIEFDIYEGEKQTKKKVGVKKCTYTENLKRKGIIPSLLDDLLSARKAAKKQMDNAIDPFQKAVYNGKQLALKVTANSVYGYTGAKFSDLRFMDLAASTTAVGRLRIYTAKDLTEKNYPGSVIVYGDSVAPDTPLILRRENGNVTIKSIDQIVSNWDKSPIDDTGKQHSSPDEKFKVWTESGWTKVQNVMKHKINKKMYRVLTHTGLVDVTEDHSLLNKDGKEVTPTDVEVGTELLHSFPTEFLENKMIDKDLAFVYGFFFAEGSAGIYYSKWGIKYNWGVVNQIIESLEKCQNILKEKGITTKILDCMASSAVYKLVPVGKIKPMALEYRELFYCSNRYKKVPDIILNESPEIIQSFLEGYASGAKPLKPAPYGAYYVGDGDKNSIMKCDKNGGNSPILISKSCFATFGDCKGQIGAMGLFYIMKRVGYSVSINTSIDKPNIFRITGTKAKQKKSSIKIKKLFALPDDRCGEVYDLTTENHHFHAGVGQLIVHNTDSIFIDSSKCQEIIGKTGKEALKASIALGQQISKYITSQLREPQSLAYEKTFSPFMIISKKRYAGNKYEFDFEKYKFTSMGLVTKRRDNAPILKKIYKGVLDLMFGEDETSVAVQKAVKLYQESATDLLKGNVNIEDLIVTKTLKTGYKNPTAITHKVLAERITERDPGNAPAINERIPFVFIDPKELKCTICQKKVNVDLCKCKQCMKLYCYDHLKQHKSECVPRCRMCWTIDKVSICGVCKGSYCNKHKMIHKCSNIGEKALQGDFAETPTYIQENNILIDYRYYLDHQIRKPVSQIFELIKETRNTDPLKKILIKDNNRINKVRNITDFFK